MAFQMISKNYVNILMAQQLLHFFRIPLALFGAGWSSVFPNNLVLYLKVLKLLLLALSASKLVASSLE